MHTHNSSSFAPQLRKRRLGSKSFGIVSFKSINSVLVRTMRWIQSKAILAAMTAILLITVFYAIHVMVSSGALSKCTECVKESMIDGPGTSHTVDMPINNSSSCQNMCGPAGRCAITGQECFADIDCPGCNKYASPAEKSAYDHVRPDNDAGKLTWNMTPQYSPLTSGYGTRGVGEAPNAPPFGTAPPQANFGPSMWLSGYLRGKQLFESRYVAPGEGPSASAKDRNLRGYSVTGILEEEGPLPANY